MTTLNDFSKTDLVDDVLAAYYNMLLGSILRGEFSNAVTMSTDLTLTDGDTPIQRLNCNGANRVVKVPASASGNHPFHIINTSGSAYTLTVKSYDAVTTLRALAQGESVLVVPDGAGGYAAVGSPAIDLGALIHAATSKATPVDADELALWDSAVSALKKLTWANMKATLKTYNDGLYSAAYNAPEGMLINGYIVRTVASNNITVAVKTLSGSDPSSSNPVYVRIGNTVRTITAALSVTKNAGTNWCNAGSTELATKEIDYFVYFGYNATNGVVIGFSRIPWARTYGDYSTTTTNEAYCAISNITNAVSTDNYALAGRFNAKLSASAAYQWSVPTPDVTISYPIFETRWLDWAPQYGANGSMTYTGVTTTAARYKFRQRTMEVELYASGTTGGTASNVLKASMAYTPVNNGMVVGACFTNGVFGGSYLNVATKEIFVVQYNLGNFPLGTVGLITSGIIEI